MTDACTSVQHPWPLGYARVKPYQFSCIHRMASSSLNCLSNSYSCRARTDMFTLDCDHAAKSGRSPEIKCGLVGFLLFFLCAASTSHCSLVSGARCRASAVAFLVKESSSSTPASPAYALFLRTSRSGS